MTLFNKESFDGFFDILSCFTKTGRKRIARRQEARTQNAEAETASNQAKALSSQAEALEKIANFLDNLPNKNAMVFVDQNSLILPYSAKKYLKEKLVTSLTENTNKANRLFHIIKDNNRLPTPSDKAFKIYTLANSDKTTINEIAKEVKTDPAITKTLIQTANSAYYRRGKAFSDIDRVIIHLGLNMVKQVARGLSLISENRKGKCEKFNYDYFRSNSVARAAIAHSVIRKGNLHTPPEAFTIGLLCQIGRLILATAYPREYSEILNRITEYDSELLNMAEQNVFETDHNELTAETMKYLKLPESYYHAVLIQDKYVSDANSSITPETQELTKILLLAKKLSHIFLNSNNPHLQNELDNIIEIASRLSVRKEEFPDYFDTAKTLWANINKQFNIPFSAVASWQKIYNQAS
jgi:HD-like signal output (HDOD) protein